MVVRILYIKVIKLSCNIMPEKKKRSFLPELEFTRTDIIPSTFVNGKPPKPIDWDEKRKIREERDRLTIAENKHERDKADIDRKIRLTSRERGRPKPLQPSFNTRKLKAVERQNNLLKEIQSEHKEISTRIRALRNSGEMEYTFIGWQPAFDPSRKAQRKLKRLKTRELELEDEMVETHDRIRVLKGEKKVYLT